MKKAKAEAQLIASVRREGIVPNPKKKSPSQSVSKELHTEICGRDIAGALCRPSSMPPGNA